MNDLFSPHYIMNVTAAGLYFVLLFFVFRDMVLPRRCRSFGTLAWAGTLLTTAAAFFSHGLVQHPWESPVVEFGVIGLATIPAIVLLIEGIRNDWYFNFLGGSASGDKFDKLKEEFLSVASHELRTPLSVINGFAEILVREKLGPLNDEQKRRVRKILIQGQRLNRIIDELLDLSRIRRGKIECRKDVFDLVPVLKACLDDHQIVCEQQKIKVIDQIPDLLPDVVGDIERVTQIIVNLLNNAIKYTEPGGDVVLTASVDPVSKNVKVLVTDTGIGINEEDQKQVFREFFRAQHRHMKRYTGSGLGLAIVKQLVEAQGGTVGVHSEGHGKGSCFYFTIPSSSMSKAA